MNITNNRLMTFGLYEIPIVEFFLGRDSYSGLLKGELNKGILIYKLSNDNMLVLRLTSQLIIIWNGKRWKLK